MTDFLSTGECYETRVHDVTVTRTLGFQTPLKQWVDLYNRHCSPKGFNHRNWGKNILLMVVEPRVEDSDSIATCSYSLVLRNIKRNNKKCCFETTDVSF